MLPASNRGVGMNLCFPDVCNTPAGPATVPVPYPNIAFNAQATPFSPQVKVTMMNALNLGSAIPMTSGDEGGVAHPMIKGMGRYTMGNPIVKVNFLPGIMLTVPTTGNNGNAPAGAHIVPSVTQVFYTCAAAPVAALACARVARSGSELRIEAFDFASPTRVAAALHEMGHGEPLTLDLRANPGGRLDAALRIAQLFLPRDTPLCRLVEPDGDEVVRYARSERTWTMPLTVRVDHDTGSAAELVAAVLQYHRRAVVVGTPTRGKTTIQRFAAPRTAQRTDYVTVAQWRLPDGSDLSQRGVVPEATPSS
ncbi:MAG: S41 family peptidase [Myxococcota bacterium]